MMTSAFSVRNQDIWHATAPCIKCFEMNMAMLQQIAQTKSHHQVHLQDKEIPILTQDLAPSLSLSESSGTKFGHSLAK